MSGTAATIAIPAATTRLQRQLDIPANHGSTAAAISPPIGMPVCRMPSARPCRLRGKARSTSRPPAGVEADPAIPATSRKMVKSGERRGGGDSHECCGDERPENQDTPLAEAVGCDAGGICAEDLSDREARHRETGDRGGEAEVRLDEARERGEPLVDHRHAELGDDGDGEHAPRIRPSAPHTPLGLGRFARHGLRSYHRAAAQAYPTRHGSSLRGSQVLLTLGLVLFLQGGPRQTEGRR